MPRAPLLGGAVRHEIQAPHGCDGGTWDKSGDQAARSLLRGTAGLIAALIGLLSLSPIEAKGPPDLQTLYQKAVYNIRTAISQGLPPNDEVWKEAIADLQIALSIDPLPKKRKFGRSTAFREPYSPHLFLGIAFLHSGDRQRARQHLQETVTYRQVERRDRPLLEYLRENLNSLGAPLPPEASGNSYGVGRFNVAVSIADKDLFSSRLAGVELR